jgi:dTDP-4-amino-4,6-dideoxygalactose transaminase
VRLFPYEEQHRSNCQYLVTLVDEAAPLTRDELVAVLHAENVMARRYFHPGVHRMEPYRSQPSRAPAALPHTERLCRQVLVLPTGPSLTEADIGRVCGLLRTALENAAQVRNRLAHPSG